MHVALPVQNANVGSYKQEGFVEVLAATQSPRSTAWFQGTADAVRQYIWLFENAMRNGVEDLLILSGGLPRQLLCTAHGCQLSHRQGLRWRLKCMSGSLFMFWTRR